MPEYRKIASLTDRQKDRQTEIAGKLKSQQAYMYKYSLEEYCLQSVI